MSAYIVNLGTCWYQGKAETDSRHTYAVEIARRIREAFARYHGHEKAVQP